MLWCMHMTYAMTRINDVCYDVCTWHMQWHASMMYAMTHAYRFVFGHHAKNYFRSMSRIHEWQRRKKVRKAESYNVGKPPSKRHRVPYCKDVAPDSGESSNTAATSSGADDNFPAYERSQKITPHAAVHLADQVIMAGTHAFHNTSATESAHPRCVV